jgi:hypothetical protein
MNRAHKPRKQFRGIARWMVHFLYSKASATFSFHGKKEHRRKASTWQLLTEQPS